MVGWRPRGWARCEKRRPAAAAAARRMRRSPREGDGDGNGDGDGDSPTDWTPPSRPEAGEGEAGAAPVGAADASAAVSAGEGLGSELLPPVVSRKGAFTRFVSLPRAPKPRSVEMPGRGRRGRARSRTGGLGDQKGPSSVQHRASRSSPVPWSPPWLFPSLPLPGLSGCARSARAAAGAAAALSSSATAARAASRTAGAMVAGCWAREGRWIRSQSAPAEITLIWAVHKLRVVVFRN